MRSDLPERCAECKKVKPGHLLTRRKSHTSYNRYYWVCDACTSVSPVVRRTRRSKETPIERIVRKTLKTCGYKCEAEYKIENCIYDFAVLKLRLLIEVDSPSYHGYARQKKRDSVKDAVARRADYKLVRIRGHESVLDIHASTVVKERAIELGI